MKHDIRSILGLQGYRVGSVEQADDGDTVRVELPEEGACPQCGVLSGRGHQRAPRPSRLLWGFVGQRPLWVVLRRRRLWCPECRKAFTQGLPGVARRQRASALAQVAVLGALREQSFAALKRSWDVSYGRARRMLLRLPVPWCDWSLLVGTEGPICLGIDEHSFRGKDLVITITCLSTHQLLAILPNDRQASLRTCLRGLPDELRSRVIGVCIDLKAGFRSVVREVLPHAHVVADHFHVIHDANKRLDETRRLEQNEAKTTLPRWPLLKAQERLTDKQRMRLMELCARFPALHEHHWLKEQLRELYRCVDHAAAERHWHKLLVVMEASDDAAVLLWAKTLRNWRSEILSYFRLRITNGFTEGCHTKIKLLKRLSYGYRNVEVYIRKMLLGFLPTSFPTLAPHLLT